MNYTILPKKNYIPTLVSSKKDVNAHDRTIKKISPSVQYYCEDIRKQLEGMKCELFSENPYFSNKIDKIINIYEYLFSRVCGTAFSVSKLKPTNPYFYVFFELLHSFVVVDYLSEKKMDVILFTSSNETFIDCLTILREDYNDSYYSFNLNFTQNEVSVKIHNNSIDFLYFDLMDGVFESENNFFMNDINENSSNFNNYVVNCIAALYNTILYQKYQGIAILKFDIIIHKPILDIIYLYTCFFEKISIVKPLTSNLISNKRFLICKQYKFDSPNYDFLQRLHELTKLNTKTTLLSIELPCYFLNKIEESNISIGYQQIEQMNLIISLIKNKNKEEKLENIRKANIQKCVQWCEKHKIPHNKFLEKNNIFLPEQKETIIENIDEYEDTDEYLDKVINNHHDNGSHFEGKNQYDFNKEINENSKVFAYNNENASDVDLFYANRILEEQINMGIDEYLYHPSLYI